MRQINLLPTELKPDKMRGVALKKAEKVFIAVLITYLIAVGASVGALYFFRNKLQILEQQKTSLSSELNSLAAVETSTVYIRDRVEKYNKLEGKDVEKVNLEKFEKVFLNLPSTATVSNVNILENTVTYSVSVPTTDAFSLLLSKLIESEEYKNITLMGLGYSQDKGYSFQLSIDF